MTINKEAPQPSPEQLEPSAEEVAQVRALETDPEQAEVFRQVQDPAGRTRLDRPFTAGEAAAQDVEHRLQHERERAGRFWPADVF